VLDNKGAPFYNGRRKRSDPMDKEYIKIPNAYAVDPATHRFSGAFQPQFDYLRDLKFQGTEKVDGTNSRIYWDGHAVSIGGHTDNASDAYQTKTLTGLFLTKEMEYLFEQNFGAKQVYLFAETYGPKINGGDTYADTNDVILFDVWVRGGADDPVKGYWLSRDKVDEVAKEMGLESVPVVFEGTLVEAEAFMLKHPMSTLGGGKHEMEGLVLQPMIPLLNAKGEPIKCKLKYRDLVAMGKAAR
jgi:hypothetical protein